MKMFIGSLTNIELKMKKIVYAIMLLLAMSAGKSEAQSFTDRLHFEASVGSSYERKDIKPLDTSLKIGVDIIPNLYAFLTCEGNKSLYEKGDVRTYYSGESLGGGVGFKLLNSVKTIHALDLRVKALGSIGGADWKRTTYDASVAWYLRNEKKHYFTPVVELGYRYIDSRSKGLDNMGNLYMTVGLRF